MATGIKVNESEVAEVKVSSYQRTHIPVLTF